MTPSQSSTPSMKTHTRTPPLLCNCSETTLPYGPAIHRQRPMTFQREKLTDVLRPIYLTPSCKLLLLIYHLLKRQKYKLSRANVYYQVFATHLFSSFNSIEVNCVLVLWCHLYSLCKKCDWILSDCLEVLYLLFSVSVRSDLILVSFVLYLWKVLLGISNQIILSTPT